jgi:hypothetical protein
MTGKNTGSRDQFYVLDRSVPIPMNAGRGNKKYPWADMQIGDSFFVPAGILNTLRTRAAEAGRKHNMKFVARSWEHDGGVEGVRIWRFK